MTYPFCNDWNKADLFTERATIQEFPETVPGPTGANCLFLDGNFERRRPTAQLAFLFSRNRLNVAISRAQCLAYLVCSPRLLEARCNSIEETELVNALCRLAEYAGVTTSLVEVQACGVNFWSKYSQAGICLNLKHDRSVSKASSTGP